MEGCEGTKSLNRPCEDHVKIPPETGTAYEEETNDKFQRTKAPKRPDYVNLSEYPPGTDIEYELHYDGCHVVSKVPRWAHEKWLLKYQNAGDLDDDHPNGTILPEDHPNSASATGAAASPALLVEVPSETVADYGGKRPCVDQPSSASETADDDAAFDVHAIKRCWEAHVKIPAETAEAYAEVIRLEPTFAYVFPDLYSYHDYPDRYGFFVKDGRTVVKVKKWAGPRVPRIASKVEDPSAGNTFFFATTLMVGYIGHNLFILIAFGSVGY